MDRTPRNASRNTFSDIGAQRALLGAFLATLGATFAHFLDNSVNITSYPQPAWITPLGVMSAWAGLSALGVLGFVLLKKARLAGATLLYVYAALASAGFQHYFYGPLAEFSLKMHVLIVGEFVAALSFAACLTWLLARGAPVGTT